jgi:hypothetical protein
MSTPLKYTIEDTDRYTFSQGGRKVIFSSENKLAYINLQDVRKNEVKQGMQYPSGGYDVIDLTDFDLVEEEKKDIGHQSMNGANTVKREASTILQSELKDDKQYFN